MADFYNTSLSSASWKLHIMPIEPDLRLKLNRDGWTLELPKSSAKTS